jgi:hypothetical protein
VSVRKIEGGGLHCGVSLVNPRDSKGVKINPREMNEGFVPALPSVGPNEVKLYRGTKRWCLKKEWPMTREPASST